MKKEYEEPTVSVFTVGGMERIMVGSRDEVGDDHDNNHDNWDQFPD